MNIEKQCELGLGGIYVRGSDANCTIISLGKEEY
jgi:hypothetical protein